KYVSSAKYIIINSKLPKNLVRKPEQKLLETWHGTAYKTIGGHDYASPLGYKMRIKYSCLQHIPLLLTHICQIFNRNVINLNMSILDKWLKQDILELMRQ